MNIDLSQRTALVTGASRGIGKAIATALAASGARVLGTATSAAGAGRITEQLAAVSEGCAGFVLDVADTGSLQGLVKQFEEGGLAPDILVNNAGITRDNLMLRMSEEQWQEVINTNLNSVFRVTRAFLRGMVRARHGRIINLTSVVALSGNAGQCNYAAAKAGIIGFTRSLAREVASRGITVNAIAPGMIETDMTAALNDVQRQQMLDQIPLGRLGNVEDIAAATVFLASDAAAYITGETLNINGGMLMS